MLFRDRKENYSLYSVRKTKVFVKILRYIVAGVQTVHTC